MPDFNIDEFKKFKEISSLDFDPNEFKQFKKDPSIIGNIKEAVSKLVMPDKGTMSKPLRVVKELIMPDIPAMGTMSMPLRAALEALKTADEAGEAVGQGIGTYAEHHDLNKALQAAQPGAVAPEDSKIGFYSGKYLANPMNWLVGGAVKIPTRAVLGKTAGLVAKLTEAQGSKAGRAAAKAAEVVAAKPYETLFGTSIEKLGEARKAALSGQWLTPSSMKPLRETLRKSAEGAVEGGSLQISPKGIITNNTGINPIVASRVGSVFKILSDKGGLTAQQVQEAISLLETKAFDVALTPTEESLLQHMSTKLSKTFQQMYPKASKFTQKMETKFAAENLKGRPNLSALTDIGKSWLQPAIKQGTRGFSMALDPATPILGSGVQEARKSTYERLKKTLGK